MDASAAFPFTRAERGRYGYRYSVRQLELSDTRVFDKPAAGRAWFEQTIRDQLDLGRPDKVQIIFDRKVTKRTAGRFQTKVITKGVEPVIQAHYKHSKVKQYFKEGRALRTETTVNDPYDFAVKRTLTAETWQQLRSIGDDINDRLLDAQLQACSCAPDPETLTRLVSPSVEDGQPAPALHFGDPRVMALLACLCSFQHLFAGLTNRTLRPQIAELIGGYSPGQMTYDLRRLRRKGLIRRIPKSQRYQLTDFRPADRRLRHEDLRADRQPHPRRTRPTPTRGDRTPKSDRPRMARLRARARRQDKTGRYRGLKG